MPVLNQTIIYPSRTAICYPLPTLLLLDAYPNAVMAYSFRKLRDAYAGSAVRIRRSSDSTEQDIGFSGNDFDSASAASFIGGGSGSIAKWYDQSGNGFDALEATASKQPAYVASGIGSKPCMNFTTGSSQCLHGDNLASGTSTTWSVFSVFYITSSSPGFARIFSLIPSDTAPNDYDNTESFNLTRQSSNQALQTFHNSSERSNVSITYSTPNVIGLIFDGSNATFYRDTTAGTTGASTDTMGDTTVNTGIGRSANGADFLDGRVSELVVWKANQTSNLTGIDGDMGTYYGL